MTPCLPSRFFVLLLPASLLGAAEPQSYLDACKAAEAHAKAPAGWTASDLKTIVPGDGNHWRNYSIGGVETPLVLARAFTNPKYYYRDNDAVAKFTGNALWMTTGDELPDFLKSHQVAAADAAWRCAQLHGLPTKSLDPDKDNYKAVVELYVDSAKIFRPMRDADVTRQPTRLPDESGFADKPAYISDPQVYENYKAWYIANQSSYTGDPPYPWTQLGYTYDWAGSGSDLASIRGLSEFVIFGNRSQVTTTDVSVFAVYAVQSYVYRTGPLGQGDFAVTGHCDSLWAGTRFQPQGSRIGIAPEGEVSGGEGILVSSAGYTVDNAGWIVGPTASKRHGDGPAGTSLFLKQGGTLNNAATGWMSGDRIAVQAEAGDTVVNNRGVISASVQAIQTGAGNDTVAVGAGGVVRGGIDTGSGADLVAFDSGSTYLAVVDVASGSASRIVTGELRIDQAVLVVELDGNGGGMLRQGQLLPVVQSGQVSGTFDVHSPYPTLAFRWVTLSGPGDVALETVRQSYAFVAAQGYDRLGGIGQALDRQAVNPSSGQADLLGRLDRMTSAQEVAGAVRQLSPMVHTAVPQVTFEADRLVHDTVSSHVRNQLGRNDRRPAAARGLAAAAGPYWPAFGAGESSAYGDGFGAWGRQKSRNDVAGYSYSTWGGLSGVETRLGDGLLVGFSAAGSQTILHNQDDAGSKTTILGLRPVVYGGLATERLTADLAIGYGYNQYESDRQIDLGGLRRTAEGNHDGHEFSGMLNLGYALFLADNTVFEPLAGTYYSWLHETGFQEEGAGDANLEVGRRNSSSLKSLLGARIYHDWMIREDLTVRPEFACRWLHEFLDSRFDATASFPGGSGFVYRGMELDRDSVQVSAKVGFRLGGSVELFTGGELQCSPNFLGGAVNAGLEMFF